jgi:hypothetical protein
MRAAAWASPSCHTGPSEQASSSLTRISRQSATAESASSHPGRPSASSSAWVDTVFTDWSTARTTSTSGSPTVHRSTRDSPNVRSPWISPSNEPMSVTTVRVPRVGPGTRPASRMGTTSSRPGRITCGSSTSHGSNRTSPSSARNRRRSIRRSTVSWLTTRTSCTESQGMYPMPAPSSPGSMPIAGRTSGGSGSAAVPSSGPSHAAHHHHMAVMVAERSGLARRGRRG